MRNDPAAALPPQVKKRLWANPYPEDRRFLAEIFGRMPAHISGRLMTEWKGRFKSHGRRESNLYVMSLRDELLPELFPETGLPFHATDDEIADEAERAVKALRGRIEMYETEREILALLARTAKRYRIETPRSDTTKGKLSRMLDVAWWRRALRKRFQVVELAAIKAGCVNRRAAPYVSDEAYRRHERHARKTQQLLELLEAVNEATGEVLTLAELRDTSTANPAIRRVAMMACVRGLEERAKGLGFEAVFVTITCPSRMHARHEKSGEPNKRYDGTSPREAQRYLGRLWNNGNRALRHAGMKPGQDYFGLRTVEPHHDATPHWHMLAFVAPDKLETFVETLRAYALADSPDEHGAQERRFTVERIDPKKGSAAGYVAKYVSKNTDGAGVGEDFEAEGGASANASRAVVWARLWHIRQFQFFGVGAVSPFRELYRLDHVPEALETLIGELHEAAKAGDFAAYLKARDARQTRISMFYEEEQSKRYPGEQARKLRGVSVTGDAGPVPIVTRPDDWSIRLRQMPGDGFPWTCINNSAGTDSTGFFGQEKRVNRCKPKSRKAENCGVSEKVRLRRGVAQGREPLPDSGPSL